jgi:hypothetical protein
VHGGIRVAAYLCVVELAGMVVKNDICPGAGGPRSLITAGSFCVGFVLLCVCLCFVCVLFPLFSLFVRANRGPVLFFMLCFYALVLLAAFGVALLVFCLVLP